MSRDVCCVGDESANLATCDDLIKEVYSGKSSMAGETFEVCLISTVELIPRTCSGNYGEVCSVSFAHASSKRAMLLRSDYAPYPKFITHLRRAREPANP